MLNFVDFDWYREFSILRNVLKYLQIQDAKNLQQVNQYFYQEIKRLFKDAATNEWLRNDLRMRLNGKYEKCPQFPPHWCVIFDQGFKLKLWFLEQQDILLEFSSFYGSRSTRLVSFTGKFSELAFKNQLIYSLSKPIHRNFTDRSCNSYILTISDNSNPIIYSCISYNPRSIEELAIDLNFRAFLNTNQQILVKKMHRTEQHPFMQTVNRRTYVLGFSSELLDKFPHLSNLKNVEKRLSYVLSVVNQDHSVYFHDDSRIGYAFSHFKFSSTIEIFQIDHDRNVKFREIRCFSMNVSTVEIVSQKWMIAVSDTASHYDRIIEFYDLTTLFVNHEMPPIIFKLKEDFLNCTLEKILVLEDQCLLKFQRFNEPIFVLFDIEKNKIKKLNVDLPLHGTTLSLLTRENRKLCLLIFQDSATENNLEKFQLE